jgi:hypothetical protein
VSPDLWSCPSYQSNFEVVFSSVWWYCAGCGEYVAVLSQECLDFLIDLLFCSSHDFLDIPRSEFYHLVFSEQLL